MRIYTEATPDVDVSLSLMRDMNDGRNKLSAGGLDTYIAHYGPIRVWVVLFPTYFDIEIKDKVTGISTRETLNFEVYPELLDVVEAKPNNHHRSTDRTITFLINHDEARLMCLNLADDWRS